MDRRSFLRLTGGAPALLRAAAAPRPNVIVMLADDVGYGDLGCYGATRVRTPNLDRLAARGVRFTDAHSSSSTCTPSRYSLISGQYAWRKQGTSILDGDAALIVPPGATTLPSVMKRAGYATGCVGKWHLGLGGGSINWNGEIKPGPVEVGFDYSFIIPATGDRVPCVFVENHRVANLDPRDPIQVSYGKPIGTEPTGRSRPDLLVMKLQQGHDATIVNGISRIGYMTGGMAARWKDDQMAKTLAEKAVAFIDNNHARPFFLYFATHDIHVPRVPEARFKGRSGCGVRGDVIEELDWTAGQIMDTLERLGIADNTLFLFTSDNGPVVIDGYADGADRDLHGHRPAGPFRGGKYTIYEGGTRLPFLASWPQRIKPGVSGALIGQVDLTASMAALTGQRLPADGAPDSLNMLPALLGESKHGRHWLVEHSGGIGLRDGNWKFIPPAKGEDSGELYDLAADTGEARNVVASHPDVARRMSAALDKVRTDGRSRP